jgi:hypothetical protein
MSRQASPPQSPLNVPAGHLFSAGTNGGNTPNSVTVSLDDWESSFTEDRARPMDEQTPKPRPDQVQAYFTSNDVTDAHQNTLCVGHKHNIDDSTGDEDPSRRRSGSTDRESNVPLHHSNAFFSERDLHSSQQRVFTDDTHASHLSRVALETSASNSTKSISGDSSNATSMSETLTREEKRRKPDKRLFDKKGEPLDRIELEKKPEANPYSYQALQARSNAENDQSLGSVSDESTQRVAESNASVQIQDPPKRPALQQRRSRQEKSWRRSSEREPTPTPSSRQCPSRAISTESWHSISSKISAARSTRHTSSKSSEPSITLEDVQEQSASSQGIGDYTELRSSFRRPGMAGRSRYSSGSQSSHSESPVNSDGRGSEVSAPMSPNLWVSPAVPSPKSKWSFGRIFSRSPRLGEDSVHAKEKGNHSPSSPSISKMSSYFRQHGSKRESPPLVGEIVAGSTERSPRMKSRKTPSEVSGGVSDLKSSAQASQIHVSSYDRQPKNFLEIPKRSRERGSSDEDGGSQTTGRLDSEWNKTETVPGAVSTPHAVFHIQEDLSSSTSAEAEDFIATRDRSLSPVFRVPFSPGLEVDKFGRRKASVMPLPPWFRAPVDEEELQKVQESEKAESSTKTEVLRTEFVIDVPDHLPQSPLCPLNQKKMRICPLHGRMRS